jgi:hypothetical protein
MNSITWSTQFGQVMLGMGIMLSKVCGAAGFSLWAKIPSSRTGATGGF